MAVVWKSGWFIAHGEDERVRENVAIEPGGQRNPVWGAPLDEQQRKLSAKTVRLWLAKASAAPSFCFNY